jgi:hypothetical protein
MLVWLFPQANGIFFSQKVLFTPPWFGMVVLDGSHPPLPAKQLAHFCDVI